MDTKSTHISHDEPILSRKRIDEIHPINKQLVFGFITDSFNSCSINRYIPRLVTCLCLQFFNETKDNWDEDNMHEDLSINQQINSVKRAVFVGQPDVWTSAYLTNIASSGIHIWTFKSIKGLYWTSISVHEATKELKTSFDASDYMITNSSRSITMFMRDGATAERTPGGQIPVAVMATKRSDKTGALFNKCCQGETFKMKADFNTLTLSISFGGRRYTECCNIERIHYRAGVSLAGSQDEIALLKYEHIYDAHTV